MGTSRVGSGDIGGYRAERPSAAVAADCRGATTYVHVYVSPREWRRMHYLTRYTCIAPLRHGARRVRARRRTAASGMPRSLSVVIAHIRAVIISCLTRPIDRRVKSPSIFGAALSRSDDSATLDAPAIRTNWCRVRDDDEDDSHLSDLDLCSCFAVRLQGIEGRCSLEGSWKFYQAFLRNGLTISFIYRTIYLKNEKSWTSLIGLLDLGIYFWYFDMI